MLIKVQYGNIGKDVPENANENSIYSLGFCRIIPPTTCQKYDVAVVSVGIDFCMKYHDVQCGSW